VKVNPAADSPIVKQWLAEARVSAKVQENLDRLARSEDVRHVVVLPDVHLGHQINNGCVVATADLVYPQAVGGDIGCGLSALAFDGTAEALKDDRNAQTVIKHLYRQVPALKQANALVLPDKLAGWRLSDAGLVKESQREGAWEFETLGCGNHFVEFQQDDAGVLWLMVHSGSRAMGQVITQFHLSRATPAASGLKYLDARSPAGQAYLNDMGWAVQYATLNRLAIMARIVEIIEATLGISADEDSYLDTVHNFARREQHSGKELIVHRKSANSARLDESGLIAGSMGSPSFVVQGLGNEESLCSSSHGAGRAMSRTEARQRIKPSDLRRQLGAVQHDPRRLSELCDEAPAAYRDIRKVMQAQRDLVRRRAHLSPVLNFKYPDRRSGA
jgi:tRNA-splicing ligase RtcB (3'-phosphate/5'-hydroxy nucleic acid ligase)